MSVMFPIEISGQLLYVVYSFHFLLVLHMEKYMQSIHDIEYHPSLFCGIS